LDDGLRCRLITLEDADGGAPLLARLMARRSQSVIGLEEPRFIHEIMRRTDPPNG